MMRLALTLILVLQGISGNPLQNARGGFWRSRNRRSIGGSVVPDGSFRFVASVRVADEHLCGGTIISPSVILTAAHCVYPHVNDVMTVMVRVNNSRQDTSIYEVVDKIVHEQYEDTYNEQSQVVLNDIALLKLGKPIQNIDESSEIVTLAKQNETVNPENGSIIGVTVGWGATFGLSYNIPLQIAFELWVENQNFPETLPDQSEAQFLESIGVSNTLRSVDVTIISKEMCGSQSHYTNSFFKSGMSFDNIICSRNFDRGTSKGDSGGPLIVDKHQIGIVSGGISCLAYICDTCYYTSVGGFRDWIDAHVKNFTRSNEVTR